MNPRSANPRRAIAQRSVAGWVLYQSVAIEDGYQRGDRGRDCDGEANPGDHPGECQSRVRRVWVGTLRHPLVLAPFRTELPEAGLRHRDDGFDVRAKFESTRPTGELLHGKTVAQ